MYKHKNEILLYLMLCLILFFLLILWFANKKQVEEFKVIDDIKSDYRKKKRKARMIKQGFIGNVEHRFKKFVRVNNL